MLKKICLLMILVSIQANAGTAYFNYTTRTQSFGNCTLPPLGESSKYVLCDAPAPSYIAGKFSPALAQFFYLFEGVNKNGWFYVGATSNGAIVPTAMGAGK